MFYGKEEKIKTAKRLKELREGYNQGKGISHEKLAEALNEKYSDKGIIKRNIYLGGKKEDTISIGVLKNYEVSEFDHTKFNAGYGMNVSYLTMLADFYEVPTDYLLGLSGSKSFDEDVKHINEVTGLSDTTIVSLRVNREMEKEFDDEGMLDSFISNTYFWDILDAIRGYSEALNSEYNKKPEKINNEDKQRLNEKGLTVLPYYQMAAFHLSYAQFLLGNTIKEIGESKKELNKK